MTRTIDDGRKATAPAIISAGKNPSGIDSRALAARKPWQPKPESPLTATRLQLKAGGYDIIPVHDKKGGKGWPSEPNDPATIREKWRGMGAATGIRMYRNDVFVIDIDISIQAVVDAILAAYTARWPAFMRDCLRRHSGGAKLALIGRANTTMKSRKTSRFFAGPDDASTGNFVEFFGRNDRRLTVVQGRHSEGRDYGYHGDAIWDRPLDSLPWFQNEGVIPPFRYGDEKQWVIEEEMEALGIAEVIMHKHGLVRRATAKTHRQGHAARGSDRVYDLEPDDEIKLANGDEITLEDLEFRLKNGMKTLPDVDALTRCPTEIRLAAYANIWDPASTTPDRVLISIGSTGLCLWDTKTSISHRWKHRAPPPDDLGDQLRALMANTTLPWRKTP
jgi:hypothetical protein